MRDEFEIDFSNLSFVFLFRSGLLGGHVSARYINAHYPPRLSWYRDELLVLAHDLGTRLLPAFNTTSGLPLPRVNLRHGIDLTLSKSEREKFTCTACAGTLILEWATLSRLTGNYLFEQYADRALDYLWDRRHRQSNLMGTILNVHSGDWIVRESGIGAGIDSYYEYLFKAYVLLGEEKYDYLTRFQEHYSSIMSYVQQGVAMVNVHMHQPYRLAKNHMDALLAFWPGLQVMTGDLKPAIELHEMLYQVVRKHNFLPEAFTIDYRIHWNSHPLRPEFVESTYFLYKATGDPHYLEVGRTILLNLEKHARVPCGYAALSDVSTGQKEDRMDSFVLAETFKYLYLLFDSDHRHFIDIDQFIFSTEAHLLPMNFFRFNINQTLRQYFHDKTFQLTEIYDKKTNISSTDKLNDNRAKANQCPAIDDQLNSHRYKEQLRENIRSNHDMTETVTTTTTILTNKPNRTQQRLSAQEFSAGNPEHVLQLTQMGIQIKTIADGRIQLIHNSGQAASNQDASNGLEFIQEMMQIVQNPDQIDAYDQQHRSLTVIPLIGDNLVRLPVGSAQFGEQLHRRQGLFAQLTVIQPFSACSPLFSTEHVYQRIGLVRRGDCMFIDKARQLEQVQARAGIIIDHNTSLKSANGVLLSMTGDGFNNVIIPVVLMFKDEAFQLLNFLSQNPNLIVYIGDEQYFHESFLQQIEYLESLISSLNGTCSKWIYEKKSFERITPCLSKQLKSFERLLHSQIESISSMPLLQFEHVIEAHENQSIDEITSQLFTQLNLTEMNINGKVTNIQDYRLLFDQLIHNALNQTLTTNKQQQTANNSASNDDN